MNRSLTVAVGMSIACATLVACGDSEEKKAADFCSVVAQTLAAQESITALLSNADLPVPADVKTAIDAFRARLSEMASAAPAELKDEMILVVNGFTSFDLGLQKVDYDYARLFSDEEAAQQAQTDMAAMDAPETQAAMDAVDEYSLANCGIALDTSGA